MSSEDGVVRSATAVLVQGSLAKIPIAGDYLAASWSEWDTRRRFARFEQMLKLVQEKLSALTLNIDPKGDAGMHLLELVLDEGQRQHSDKKREYLANVLVSAWVSDQPAEQVFDESLLFLRATELFGDAHIAILNKLHETGPAASIPFGDLAQLVSDVQPAERDGATLIILNHLCAEFSFVRRSWDLNTGAKGGGVLITQNLGPENIALKCMHAITARGQRYVRFVLLGRAGAEDGSPAS